MTEQNDSSVRAVDPVVNRLPAARGMAWMTEGFTLFSRAPGVWIGSCLLLFVITLVLAILPLVSMLVTLFTPVIMAGWMVACRSIEERGQFQLADVFAGFKRRTDALVIAGAIYLGTSFVFMFVVVGLFALLALSAGGEDGSSATAVVGFLLVALLGLALMIPVLMAYYFAPALLVFNEELGVLLALKLSLIACIKNMLPFLLFGLLALLASVVAAIPFFLGYFVLVPVLIAANYAAYVDIFEARVPPEDASLEV